VSAALEMMQQVLEQQGELKRPGEFNSFPASRPADYHAFAEWNVFSLRSCKRVCRRVASMDLFVVPTVSFRLLYGPLILQHGRRQILWLGATAHPTAEWITRR